MTGPATLRPAVFLDRDGVINRDTGYLFRPEEFELLPGVVPALQHWQAQGRLLVVVSNQSGIARGKYGPREYEALTAHMVGLLAAQGITLDAIHHCPHLPDAEVPEWAQDCDCRKPRPGMLLAATAALGIDVAASLMVGDKVSDVQAGRAAGVARCCLVRSGQALSEADEACADAVFPDLLACAQTPWSGDAVPRPAS